MTVKRNPYAEQLLVPLKKLVKSHMEAELEYLALPNDERLRRRANYWWDRAMRLKKSRREV